MASFLKKTGLLLMLTALSVFAKAQSNADTLFAQVYNNRLMLTHMVEKGERLSQIAQRYGIAPETLAAENGIAFAAALTHGVAVRIPLDRNNLSDSFAAGDRPVYFRCAGRENFVLLAGSIGLHFRNLQALNPGLKQYCTGGSLVLIGYLGSKSGRPDEVIPETDAPQPIDDTPVVAPVENFPENPLPEPAPTAEAAFNTALEAGVPMVEQTGPVTFFPGGSGELYYAFHNAASHGAILRLRNPANGRVVYAKVIGRVPGTKNFYKALAGVSDNARRALGCLGDARLWCEISYAGY